MIRSPLLVAIASGGRLNDRRSRSVDESRRGTGRTGNRAHATRDERGCPGLPCRKPEAKPVNDKSETIGRINDLIFGKDGNICAVPAVGDFTGLGGQLVAIPYRSLKLDDSSGYIVLPGASRSALRSKNCRFSSAVDSASYSFSSGHLFLRRIATTYQPIDNAEREDRRRQ